MPQPLDVRPSESIQDALDEAAATDCKIVRVHEGRYRPTAPSQALIRFNARHDGIRLEAVGEVELTAANEEVAAAGSPSFPAVVNHVVYFGDGISAATVFSGFKITGANNFVTREGSIEPNEELPKMADALFFFADGGAVKVFGRSYPTLERLRIVGNYASPCAGGISVEHCGFIEDTARVRDCVFEQNRSQISGAAVDILPGSSLFMENCLFVGNISNTGEDFVSRPGLMYHNPDHGSGPLTVFPESHAEVRRCTFTRNWNGVDDKGARSRYTDCIFWQNDVSGGISRAARYEMDVDNAEGIRGCFISGSKEKLRADPSPDVNTLNAPDPDFDRDFVPRSPIYVQAGFRPVVS